MRPQSVTDQIFIKANRIRSLEIKGTSMVDEGIRPEFIAIVNYGVIGLVQLALGFADTTDITIEKALELYDKYIAETKELMLSLIHIFVLNPVIRLALSLKDTVLLLVNSAN